MGAKVVATQASPETMTTLKIPIEVHTTTLQSMQIGVCMARRLRMYNAACGVRVKNEVLQVSNRAECFILATEVSRDAAAGRSGVRASPHVPSKGFPFVVLSRTLYSSRKESLFSVMTINLLMTRTSTDKVDQRLLCATKDARKYGTIASLSHPLLMHRRAASRGSCSSFSTAFSFVLLDWTLLKRRLLPCMHD